MRFCYCLRVKRKGGVPEGEETQCCELRAQAGAPAGAPAQAGQSEQGVDGLRDEREPAGAPAQAGQSEQGVDGLRDERERAGEKAPHRRLLLLEVRASREGAEIQHRRIPQEHGQEAPCGGAGWREGAKDAAGALSGTMGESFLNCRGKLQNLLALNSISIGRLLSHQAEAGRHADAPLSEMLASLRQSRVPSRAL